MLSAAAAMAAAAEAAAPPPTPRPPSGVLSRLMKSWKRGEGSLDLCSSSSS